MSRKPTWVTVDVSGWAYRDYFAAGPGEKSFRNFVNRMELCRDTLRPERLILCFDSDGSFRRDLDAGYKAQRNERPAGLDALLRRIYVHAIEDGIDCVAADGFEADDCIATLTGIALDQGRRMVIASADKDCHQLLIAGAVTQLTHIARGEDGPELSYMTTAALMERHGLHPHQWIEYQMLVGDNTDNIRGCNGIGEKAAKELLTKCETLERYYRTPLVPNLTGRQRARLSDFRRHGMDLARKLVTLRSDVPLPAGWFEHAA